jgi:hypothetical protein
LQPPSFTTTLLTVPLLPFSSLIPTLLPRAARSAALGSAPTARRVHIVIPRRFYAKSRKMPPKKVVQEEKIPLGRPGNSLKSGIVSFLYYFASHDTSSQLPTNTCATGWSCKRWQINIVPGHHKMQPWQPSCMRPPLVLRP